MFPEYILYLQVLFLPPQNLLTYHESNKAKSVSKMRLFLNLLHFSYLNDSIREHQSQHHIRMRHSHQSFWKGFPQPHAAANLRDVTAISSFQPYCFLKQWQLSPGTPWILLSQTPREWSITNIWSNEPCKKGGRAAVDVSGGQEGDRQRDHFANLQASFVFFIPIFYLHHDFPSIVSPGYYGAFMFSFPPTPSVISCLFLLIWAWEARLICHTIELPWPGSGVTRAVVSLTNVVNTPGVSPLCSRSALS